VKDERVFRIISGMYGSKEGERVSGYLRDICQYTGFSARDTLAFVLEMLADKEVFVAAHAYRRGKEMRRSRTDTGEFGCNKSG